MAYPRTDGPTHTSPEPLFAALDSRRAERPPRRRSPSRQRHTARSVYPSPPSPAIDVDRDLPSAADIDGGGGDEGVRGLGILDSPPLPLPDRARELPPSPPPTRRNTAATLPPSLSDEDRDGGDGGSASESGSSDASEDEEEDDVDEDDGDEEAEWPTQPPKETVEEKHQPLSPLSPVLHPHSISPSHSHSERGNGTNGESALLSEHAYSPCGVPGDLQPYKDEGSSRGDGCLDLDMDEDDDLGLEDTDSDYDMRDADVVLPAAVGLPTPVSPERRGHPPETPPFSSSLDTPPASPRPRTSTLIQDDFDVDVDAPSEPALLGFIAPEPQLLGFTAPPHPARPRLARLHTSFPDADAHAMDVDPAPAPGPPLSFGLFTPASPPPSFDATPPPQPEHPSALPTPSSPRPPHLSLSPPHSPRPSRLSLPTLPDADEDPPSPRSPLLALPGADVDDALLPSAPEPLCPAPWERGCGGKSTSASLLFLDDPNDVPLPRSPSPDDLASFPPSSSPEAARVADLRRRAVELARTLDGRARKAVRVRVREMGELLGGVEGAGARAWMRRGEGGGGRGWGGCERRARGMAGEGRRARGRGSRLREGWTVEEGEGMDVDAAAPAYAPLH